LLYPETVPLSLETRQIEPGVTVIEIGGTMAIGRESGRIEAAVLKALNEGEQKLVIDLSHVTYIDSTGIGVIAYCFGKIAQKGVKGAVAGARGLVMDVFKLTRLDSVIPFFPDVASASDGLAAAGPSA
jgi:anti-sigma B factor antagonist